MFRTPVLQIIVISVVVSVVLDCGPHLLAACLQMHPAKFPRQLAMLKLLSKLSSQDPFRREPQPRRLDRASQERVTAWR